MESSPTQLLKLLLPKTPFILKTALLHSIGHSHTSSKWDLKTELTINILRQMLGPSSKPQPLGKLQRMTTKDPGVKGAVWVSKVKLEVPPEDDLREVLFKSIEEMKNAEETYTKPDAVPLEAEWTGYRAGVSDSEPEPTGLSEEEKFQKLIRETKNETTVLYFHGGAMFLLDPATYRPLAGRVARTTGGKVFNVRYRLSPQNPFPAALLDAFTAYLSLLYPPPGAPHKEVPASKIVVGGDSAGGLLATALLQLLLQIHRTTPAGQTPRVKFHGQDVEIPLPAGLALNSPWLDVTRSLPSIEKHAKYDYLPPPSQSAHARTPHDDIWPTKPPRADIYCDGPALCHPLVSTLAAKDWTNSPPVGFFLGEEMLADEDAVLAQRMAKQGVKVNWIQYEAMPHCFSLLLEGLLASELYWDRYADWIRTVVEHPEDVQTEGSWFKAKSMVKEEVDVSRLTKLTDEEVAAMMKEGMERLEKGLDDTMKAMPLL